MATITREASSNKKLLKLLIAAQSSDEGTEILHCDYVQGLAWKPYGGYYRNFNTIGNQQKQPEYALAEKVVNSIDAQIMNGLLLKGIDPEAPDAPQSPAEAVRILYGFDQESLREMLPSERIKPRASDSGCGLREQG